MVRGEVLVDRAPVCGVVDLRGYRDQLLFYAGERLVADLMTLNPVTVHQDKLAVEVLKLLESHRIDDLVVVDDDKVPVGVVDSQDLTRLKLL